MLVVKRRCQPVNLAILTALNKRMELHHDEKQYLLNLEKGFEGETQFDRLVEQLTCEGLVLNDLLLTINGTTCQIDSLIVTANTLYLYEIKNYEGNFQYKLNQLYTFSGKEINNPLTQLNRTATLMRQLIKQLGADLELEAAVLFINPSFMLYEASVDKPYIFPAQLQAHFAKMNRDSLPLSKKHQFLADKLIKLHHKEAVFPQQLPSYAYDNLKKGLTCIHCGSFDLSLTQRKCRCKSCGHVAPIETAFCAQVEECRLLFPELRITKILMHDWCGGALPIRKIAPLLSTNYEKCGDKRGRYYK